MQKIKLTTEVADLGNHLGFLDLKVKWENGKTSIDLYSKATNNFMYFHTKA